MQSCHSVPTSISNLRTFNTIEAGHFLSVNKGNMQARDIWGSLVRLNMAARTTCGSYNEVNKSLDCDLGLCG